MVHRVICALIVDATIHCAEAAIVADTYLTVQGVAVLLVCDGVAVRVVVTEIEAVVSITVRGVLGSSLAHCDGNEKEQVLVAVFSVAIHIGVAPSCLSQAVFVLLTVLTLGGTWSAQSDVRR